MANVCLKCVQTLSNVEDLMAAFDERQIGERVRVSLMYQYRFAEFFGFPPRVLSFGKEEVIKCYRCCLWQKPVVYRGERKGKACAMAFKSIALHV